MKNQYVPVITLDGPSASGKGTIARLVSQVLGFHYLDSGALYRLVALAAMKRGVDAGDEQGVVGIARSLDVSFADSSIRLDGIDVSDEIRAEACGEYASKIAQYSALRVELLERQRGFRKLPGLVADGRDMGSVIFPDATLKIYLTANEEERARRRHKQLMEKGINASIANLVLALRERDERDSKRVASPLQQCEDTRLLDTTGLNIDQVVGKVLGMYADSGSR
ncbi:(d)CMP kinase [Nitrosomonas eutropha]|uniref:(d)CMP kinase n=1 Tax=Nitrosomonas eutropha TaxID=916 RepID=UPI000889213A|nr:(d)CMP kinase [Nitrosomonas eutropha]SCX20806.1 cytidylate kinase [Nitrosomonas eutropha]SEI42223.1 cytidylate kinase [Nitrosomonas eutropha]